MSTAWVVSHNAGFNHNLIVLHEIHHSKDMCQEIRIKRTYEKCALRQIKTERLYNNVAVQFNIRKIQNGQGRKIFKFVLQIILP